MWTTSSFYLLLILKFQILWDSHSNRKDSRLKSQGEAKRSVFYMSIILLTAKSWNCFHSYLIFFVFWDYLLQCSYAIMSSIFSPKLIKFSRNGFYHTWLHAYQFSFFDHHLSLFFTSYNILAVFNFLGTSFSAFMKGL